MTDNKTYVDLSNAGRPGDDGSYKKILEQIQKDNVCPFCTEYLKQYHKNPILKETDSWILTTNMYPYENAKHHFLLVLKNHKTDTKDLSSQEWQNLHEQVTWIIDSYKIPGGTLIMRSGNTAHTGATVTHLHAQFISPDYKNPERKPVLARVG